MLDVCFFLCCGFIAGDCLTLRAGVFVDPEDAFLRDRRTLLGLETEVGPLYSRLMSRGDVVVEVSEPRTLPYIEL